MAKAEKIYVNGINAATGDYFTKPMTVKQVVRAKPPYNAIQRLEVNPVNGVSHREKAMNEAETRADGGRLSPRSRRRGRARPLRRVAAQNSLTTQARGKRFSNQLSGAHGHHGT